MVVRILDNGLWHAVVTGFGFGLGFTLWAIVLMVMGIAAFWIISGIQNGRRI